MRTAAAPVMPRSTAVRRTTWHRLWRHPSALAGLLLLSVILLVAVFAPVLTLHSPVRQDLSSALSPPSRAHPFGTDEFGRDILARVMFGARISLTVGLLVVLIAMVGGVLLGLLAGYYGGWTDEVISRAIEILLAFPGFLLALAVLAMLGPSLTNAMLAVAISSMPAFARVVRGTVLSERSRDYVHAARALGCGDSRILLRHLLPNVGSAIFVLATLRVGTAILTTASLSFLGLGAQPPTPEWGAMLAMGRSYIRRAWWLTFFPGLAIALTVLALNLLGDGLRDILDPRLRQR
ncbi:MAG: nickel transporter permease [Armatimonadota bacterium]